MQTELDIDSNQVILQKTTMMFDVSVWEIFMPLCYGQTMVLAPEESLYDFHQLAGLIDTHQVSVMHFVPTALQAFLAEASEYLNKLGSLKTVIASGEALPQETVNQYYKHFEAPLYNLYGPTEASIDVSGYLTQPGDDTVVPIGAPIWNTKLYVVDESMELLAPGIPGEILIGGIGLAEGYQNKEKLTAEKFQDDPFCKDSRIYFTGDLGYWNEHGQIVFLGRKDHQVKLRGHRIELGEIENQLLQIEGIEQAAVVMREHRNNNPFLIAYCQGNALSLSQISEALSQSLPEYMIPEQVQFLDTFPLTLSGKTDRKKLMSLPLPETASVLEAPQTETEQLLVDIWKDILNLPQVGIRDNFFSLGGDSIKAIQLATRLHEHDLRMGVKEIFLYPEIQSLAGALKHVQTEASQKKWTGYTPLSPIQQYFFERYKEAPDYFNQSVMLHLPLDTDEQLIRNIFTQLVDHHDMLRATFRLEEDKRVQYLNEEPDFHLETHDLRGVEEANQKQLTLARQLQSGMALENGPMLRMALFHREEESRLLVACHHLAIDTYSWRILAQDFETLLEQATQGEPFALPLKTDGYPQWMKRLEAYAETDKAHSDAQRWGKITGAYHTALIPGTRDELAAVEQRVDELFLQLTAEETKKLTTQVHAVYNADVRNVLLSSLVAAASNTFGQEQLLVDMEGHGREELDDETNVQRTVGWFTCLYPVLLNYDKEGSIHDNLAQVKKDLAQVPEGTTYGITQYLMKGLKPVHVQASVLFNYLGQFSQSDTERKGLRISGEGVGPNVAIQNAMTHDIEVSGRIAHDTLVMGIKYNPYRHSKSAIESLKEGFHKALSVIIEESTRQSTNGVQPGDIADVDISVDELDTLFE